MKTVNDNYFCHYSGYLIQLAIRNRPQRNLENTDFQRTELLMRFANNHNYMTGIHGKTCKITSMANAG